MKRITEITDSAKQRMDILLEDGRTFEFKLEYVAQQQGWFYSLKFNNLTINGCRVSTGLNILRQYKNILPFGISVVTDDLSEPIFKDDFSSGRVGLYLLTSDEVKTIEKEFYNL